MGSRARDGKMGVDEFSGGTFTISNGGMMHLKFFFLSPCVSFFFLSISFFFLSFSAIA
jgi:pyruvate/2-oxoglutarate dehydrogenase complex dihydrolipoamide acyltransferase (E2) component